jgi:hypothetical protein
VITCILRQISTRHTALQALISDLTRIRTINGRTAPSAGVIVHAARTRGGLTSARSNDVARGHRSIEQDDLAFVGLAGLCTAMPLGVGHSLDVRQWVCQEEGSI